MSQASRKSAGDGSFDLLVALRREQLCGQFETYLVW